MPTRIPPVRTDRRARTTTTTASTTGTATATATTPATATAPVPAPAPGPYAATRHIAPLDGLRGLAVLGVLFFHAGHFSGGFLGVDLFFVLSGFLITGLLLKETQAHNGRVDLVAFWGRRARRLLPALAVTVAGTLILVWAFGPPSLLRHALDDAPWVAANLANWHFISDQVGYWNAADTRVFGHLWSIAVEEQFYLIWPLLVGLAARGHNAHRRDTHQGDTHQGHAHQHKAHQRVAVMAAVGATVSLVLMFVFTVPTVPTDSTRVYEGTDTRAFSLLLGSLMATAPASRLLARAGGSAAGWASLVLACGIGAYWATADGQDAPSLFQGGLFLHALAAALLIAFLAQAPRNSAGRVLRRVLAAPPLRWFGLISYSLYLWHWPVYLLLSEERLGMSGWSRTAVILAVSIAAAWLSKVLVEDPIRYRARWAKGRTGSAALLATIAALAALWALIPQPQTGAGSVDVTRLTSTDE